MNNQARLYQGEQAGLSNQAPPPRTSWSISGKLTRLSADTEVGAQATFPDPGAYTVSFNVRLGSDLINASPATPVRAEALITWSVAGNSVTRRVSVGDGISISGVAEAVSVVVKDTSDPAIANPASGDYSVVIIIAKGTRAAYNQPPTLQARPSVSGGSAIINVAPGGSTSIAVPQDAGVISVHVSAGCQGNPKVVIPDQSVQVQQVGAVVEKIYDPRATDWEPLNPGITRINLVVDAAFTNTVGFQIVFGIDG